MSIFEIFGLVGVFVVGLAAERYVGILSRFHPPKH